MTKQQAEQQAQIFREFGKDLNQSLKDVMVCGASGASGRQFSDYRDIIGRLLGSSFFTVLHPVWSRYPNIEPEEMRRHISGDSELVFTHELADEDFAAVSHILARLFSGKRGFQTS